MKRINFISRLKIVVVMWAILLLILGVADAFIDMKMVNDLLFHSLMFHALVFAACWLLAPIVANYVDA